MRGVGANVVICPISRNIAGTLVYGKCPQLHGFDFRENASMKDAGVKMKIKHSKMWFCEGAWLVGAVSYGAWLVGHNTRGSDQSRGLVSGAYTRGEMGGGGGI